VLDGGSVCSAELRDSVGKCLGARIWASQACRSAGAARLPEGQEPRWKGCGPGPHSGNQASTEFFPYVPKVSSRSAHVPPRRAGARRCLAPIFKRTRWDKRKPPLCRKHRGGWSARGKSLAEEVGPMGNGSPG